LILIQWLEATISGSGKAHFVQKWPCHAVVCLAQPLRRGSLPARATIDGANSCGVLSFLFQSTKLHAAFVDAL
jgi:hypothetical protein